MRPVSYVIAIALLLPLIVGCGRKAPPRWVQYETPPSPTGLKAHIKDNAATISWEYPDSKRNIMEKFIIMRDNRQIAEQTGKSYGDAGLAKGSRHEYRIIAQGVKAKTNSKPSEPLIVANENNVSPPDSLAFKITNTGVELSWRYPLENAVFNIYKSAKEGDSPMMPLNPMPIQQAFYPDAADMKSPVYYIVRALIKSQDGVYTYESPASNEIVVSPGDFVPSMPSGIVAVAATDRVVITWAENPESWVTGYKIYRSSGGGAFEPVGFAQVPSFTDANPPKGALTYRVSAVGPVKEGPHAEAKVNR